MHCGDDCKKLKVFGKTLLSRDRRSCDVMFGCSDNPECYSLIYTCPAQQHTPQGLQAQPYRHTLSLGDHSETAILCENRSMRPVLFCCLQHGLPLAKMAMKSITVFSTVSLMPRYSVYLAECLGARLKSRSKGRVMMFGGVNQASAQLRPKNWN
jgi:hypothetical protein